MYNFSDELVQYTLQNCGYCHLKLPCNIRLPSILRPETCGLNKDHIFLAQYTRTKGASLQKSTGSIIAKLHWNTILKV